MSDLFDKKETKRPREDVRPSKEHLGTGQPPTVLRRTDSSSTIGSSTSAHLRTSPSSLHSRAVTPLSVASTRRLTPTPTRSPGTQSAAVGQTPFPASPAAQRAEKWGALLLPHMMIGLDDADRPVVQQLCQRIAAAVPGGSMEARDTFLMLLANLKDPLNTELRSRLLSGDLPVEVLVRMGEKELVNPERRRELEEGFLERSKDKDLTELAKAKQTSSKIFPCPACHARDCSWVQRQTRSGDEPMTIICSCNQCNHQWRKY